MRSFFNSFFNRSYIFLSMPLWILLVLLSAPLDIGVSFLFFAAILVICIKLWSQNVLRAIATAQKLIQWIESGQLTQIRPEIKRKDEWGKLHLTLITINKNLTFMVQSIRANARSIANASAEIAMGNQDFANRTQQTSAYLMSTALAMDRLTGTLLDSAENTTQAAGLAGNAAQISERGTLAVRDVVITMQTIHAHSKQILDISTLLNGIAFQTNILALNAAVEAARIGDKGRGFAVVASEVRNLSTRSADAANEIRSLISTSYQKIDDGSVLVNKAEASIMQLANSVQTVVNFIDELSHAAQIESKGINEVNQSIGHLEQMTQQNSSLVQDSSQSAENLRIQSALLFEVVNNFS